MDFQTLKASVESSIGRSDVPDFVYTLMMADVNRDIRIIEMQAETTLTATAEAVTLPSDFLMVDSVYIDDDTRSPLVPITRQSEAVRHNSSGRPYYYAITDGEMQLMPVPDGSYPIVLRYYTKLADFSENTDDNAVINLHPGLFLYSALHHVAVWKQDIELAMSYGQAYQAQSRMIIAANKKKRNSGPMVQRPAVPA
jgi:hypothetical protein